METAPEIIDRVTNAPANSLLIILSIAVVGLSAYAIHAVLTMAKQKDRKDG